MLYIFGGLPVTGKTELSRHLAKKIGAVHLRIDTIEQTIRDSGFNLVGPEGYQVGYAIAADNLALGLAVIADSVNPLHITRSAWREVANQLGLAYVEIEVIFSDADEHRHRVETRSSQIEGLRLPSPTGGLRSWQDVVERDYDPWEEDHIVIDTAGRTVEESKAELETLLKMGHPRFLPCCHSEGTK